jgi:hypothetical protein
MKVLGAAVVALAAQHGQASLALRAVDDIARLLTVTVAQSEACAASVPFLNKVMQCVNSKSAAAMLGFAVQLDAAYEALPDASGAAQLSAADCTQLFSVELQCAPIVLNATFIAEVEAALAPATMSKECVAVAQASKDPTGLTNCATPLQTLCMANAQELSNVTQLLGDARAAFKVVKQHCESVAKGSTTNLIVEGGLRAEVDGLVPVDTTSGAAQRLTAVPLLAAAAAAALLTR